MLGFSRKFAVIKQFSTLSTRFVAPFSQYPLEKKQLGLEIVSVLDSCTSFRQIKQVHAQIYLQGLDQYCYVLTKLIRVLTKLDVPMDPYARLVFEQVNYPYPFLWTALIRGYCVQGKLFDSIRLYCRMRAEGFGPLSFTFSALFKACGDVGDVNLGRQIHAQTVLMGGFDSDLHVGNTLIDMYAKCGVLGCARIVFDEMPRRDRFSWTTLVRSFAKSGDMEAAGGLFDELPEKDSVAWASMVIGYAQNGRPREALEFFGRMQEAGFETDDATLIGVISACAQLGAANYARWVGDIAENSGVGIAENVRIGSALIDMYSKCGSLEDAYRVFERMRERNGFTYSSMMLGFATHGHSRDAIQLFHEMIEKGVEPNDVTFVALLTACRHAGMVQQGRQFFAMMEFYGIEPTTHHYGCMVDLLGRAGHLEEALELAKTMPMEPHAEVWGALLGACHTHGNADIAQIAASHLFELEPNVSANYILLINIYASAGRWSDVLRVRKLMWEKGVKRIPACSWLEQEISNSQW